MTSAGHKTASLDDVKLGYLNALTDRTLSPSARAVRLETAGVQGELHLSGERADEIAQFLDSYFKPFPLTRPFDPDGAFHLTYFALPGKLGEGSHPHWNEVEGSFRFFGSAENKRIVVHRDFVAEFSADGREIVATGPVLGPETTDSIDNVLMVTISRLLPLATALAIHAATVEKNGEAYVFFGASGAGKSTLARHCFEKDGLRVLSGDQIYLRTIETGGSCRLFAYPAPSTIPEFPRHHPGFCPEPKPVRALIHLVRPRGVPSHISFRMVSAREALPNFLRETIYHPEFRDAESLLETALGMVHSPAIALGELSYPKGVSFWPALVL